MVRDSNDKMNIDRELENSTNAIFLDTEIESSEK